MAYAYDWESFIRIHGGEPGARDMFEKLLDDLLRQENPNKEVHIVRASPGDEGIDVYVSQKDGIDVYQCKFFMRALEDSQWQKIKKSFDAAMKPKGVTILRWILCMPREMHKEDLKKWDNFKKKHASSGIEIRLVDGNEIVARMQECDRLNNTNLMNKYFGESRRRRFTNKERIIPFTMSYANGAQGGTYVSRDDLLRKIEHCFRTKRMVFLTGMGGCGKSEMARAFAYKHRDDFDEIFWLTCDDSDKKPDLMSLMSKSDPLSKIEKTDIVNFSNRVLIIIDNCNIDYEGFLYELERETNMAKILITTRLSRIGNYNSIIPVESDDPDTFAYAVFSKNYCKKPRWGRAKEICDDEAESISDICRTVQFNTMIISLVAIRLREKSDLTISKCASQIIDGVGTITGKIDYTKDHEHRSENLKEILRFLFLDILNYPFSNAQREVLSVLSLTPALWHSIDYITSLLDVGDHEYAMKSLLDLGWIQGDSDKVTIHPLIAEVMADDGRDIIIKTPDYYENILRNYLGLPDELLGREKYLINKAAKLSHGFDSKLMVAIMLVINHGGYRSLFSKIHPEVNVAYFVYVNNYKNGVLYRSFEYRDLQRNKTYLLLDILCRVSQNEDVRLLSIYNVGVPYKLDLNVIFHGKWIKDIPDNICSMDQFVSGCDLGLKITTIGNSTFYGCKRLRGEVCFPEELKSIGNRAFSACDGLIGELRFPESLTSIGDEAFLGCKGLSGKLNLPKNLTYIGNRAFSGCKGLNGELCLPERLIYLGDRAFYLCKRLNGNLHLPATLTSIGNGTFDHCKGLDGELLFPQGLVSIGNNAFAGCEGIKCELHLPESLTSIGKKAFYGCISLKGELILPVRVTSIGDEAFSGCKGLSGEPNLPETLTNIGNDVFFGCTDIILPDWFFKTKNKSRYHRRQLLDSQQINGGINRKKSIEANQCNGSGGELNMPEGLVSIGDMAYFGRSDLVGNLNLPKSIRYIGEKAFYGCSGLRGELNLPKNLNKLGNGAFEGCYGMSGELRLPEALTCIGDNVFRDCKGLTGELYMSETVKIIGDNAFSGCEKLSGKLRLPRSVVSIGRRAFAFCRGLSGELYLPDELISIGVEAFYKCSGLRGKVHFSKKMTVIGKRAFYGCRGLNGELELLPNLLQIGEQAFYGCSLIEKIIFYNPDTKIDGVLNPYASFAICGYKNSTAEKYAYENGLVFEELT